MTTKKGSRPPRQPAKSASRRTTRSWQEAVKAWFTEASLKQWLVRALIAGAAGLALLILLFAVAYASVSLPKEPESAQTSVVLASDGTTVLAELYEENREDVSLDDVADVMEQAVIAAEDRNFYRHTGVDPIGVARALWNDIRRKSLQGGSTITQQLVKNQYLSPERSLSRKAKEAILAVKVERELSKDEILERYLNTVYFGRGAYGVEKAAELYFGKDAADLTLSDAAFLAGLIRAPERADPDSQPEEATRRRALVLGALVRTGVIEQTEADQVDASPLETVPRGEPGDDLGGPTGYFVQEVREWSVRQFGERLTYGGGLRIETTLDNRMQQIAARVVAETLPDPEDPDAALIAMDDTGAVLAMIGGRDYATDKVNMAIGREGGNGGRQPGSTFKPIVLAAALESGIPISQRYPGPAQMDVEFDGFPPYEVHNYDDAGYGQIDLVQATANSVNTTYAQLASDAGLENIVTTAADLGVESEIEPLPAMSLGSEEVNPQEMLRAYMTFATRGERVEPYYVRRVLQGDGPVYEANARREEDAYPRQYADVVNHALQEVVERGTGRAADIGRPVAGKTGTTSNYVDAWFIGYTPKIGAAVWMGHKEDSLQQMTSVHGRRATGGSFPARMWGEFMAEALEGIDTGEFAEPEEDLLRAPTSEVPEETTTTEDPESTTTSSTETTLPEDESTTTTEPDGGTTTTTAADSTTTTTAPPTTTTTAQAAGAGGGGGGPPDDSS